MNTFNERYKTLSNVTLLEIINSPEDYVPEAIDAAKKELTERQLSDKELSAAQTEWVSKQEQVIKRTKQQQLKDQATKTGIALFEFIDPLINSNITAKLLWSRITVIFALLSVYRLYHEYIQMGFWFTSPDLVSTAEIIFQVLTILFLPVSIILFGLKKKAGWVMLVAYLTHSVLISTIMIYITWNSEYHLTPSFQDVFSHVSPVTHILSLLFFGGTIWVMIHEKIKVFFGIDQETMIITFIFSVLITLLMIYPLF